MSPQVKSLVLPVDGSEGSLRAVDHAGLLAEQLGVELQLVYVFSHEAADSFGLNFVGGGEKTADFVDAEAFAEMERKQADEVFAQARARLAHASQINVQEVTLRGDPATALLKHLAQQQAPWVVMGRQGKSTLKEIFIGSVSQKLVHRAGCPVTLVN